MKLKKRFTVEVFDADVVVVVADDIPKEYKKEFGIQIDDVRMACCGYNGRKFGLFFEPKAVARTEIVAHEVFHLTHRILDLCCMNFDSCHHEVGAYLHEHLIKKVLHILNKNQ